MSYYERQAEEREYYHFEHREVMNTKAHFHGAIEFLFVEKGDHPVIVGGEKRVIKAGEACFSDAFCVHSYEKQEGSFSYVLLGPKKYFDRIFALYGERVPPRFFHFDNFELLKNLHMLCKKTYKTEKNRLSTFEGAVKILLAEIAETNELLPRVHDRQSVLVCDILQFADDNLTEDLTLETLAKHFGYSHAHLSRLLHKQLSENWNVYVNRLRAQRADMLLRERPEDSVLEIALECGFESPNTFYRAYKKEFGILPKQRR